MKIYRWIDRRPRAVPRAVIQRGDCTRGECHQYAISISDGTSGMTIRFADADEFRHFMERGELQMPTSDLSQ